MGVIQQNAGSTDGSTVARTTSDFVQYGTPVVLTASATLAADGTDTVTIFDANCPVKYRVIDVIFYVRSLRTGGSPAHTVQLTDGTNGITDAVDADITVDLPTRPGTLIDTYDTLDVGDTLEFALVCGGTTTTGTALAEVVVTLLPVKI
jgi:hypothetical protein